MARPPNFKRALRLTLPDAQKSHKISEVSSSTVDRDGVLVLIGNDVPDGRAAFLVEQIWRKLRFDR